MYNAQYVAILYLCVCDRDAPKCGAEQELGCRPAAAADASDCAGNLRRGAACGIHVGQWE